MWLADGHKRVQMFVTYDILVDGTAEVARLHQQREGESGCVRQSAS